MVAFSSICFFSLLAYGYFWWRLLLYSRPLFACSPFRSLLSHRRLCSPPAHGCLWHLSLFRSLLAQGCFWQGLLSQSPPPSHGAKLNTRNTITYNPSTVQLTVLSSIHVPTTATNVTQNRKPEQAFGPQRNGKSEQVFRSAAVRPAAYPYRCRYAARSQTSLVARIPS